MDYPTEKEIEKMREEFIKEPINQILARLEQDKEAYNKLMLEYCFAGDMKNENQTIAIYNYISSLINDIKSEYRLGR